MTGQKLTRKDLEKFLSEIRREPQWRKVADRCCAYYDGDQLSQEMIANHRDRGTAPLVRNLIAPTVDLVLGMTAKSRRDWTVTAETEAEADVADVLSAELRKAEKVSGADQACLEAFASQVKAGIGWLEVAKTGNPMQGPYRVRSIHRDEIQWDFRSKEPDLSDARYLVRKQWMDADHLRKLFPDKADLIKHSVSGWADWDYSMEGGTVDDGGLANAYAIEISNDTSINDEEWRNTERRRLCLYEVWYRTWVSGSVMMLPAGEAIEFDKSNPRHLMAWMSGMVALEAATFSKVRLSWWIGPHQLSDGPTPYSHGSFPYVPLWGMRRDKDGSPYGLITRMLSPQDEVNARLSKLMYLLSAKRVIADSDALDPAVMDHTEALEQVGRPDGYVVLNKNRVNKDKNAFRVESDLQLAAQQFQVLQDAAQAIQDVAGVYQAMLGKEEPGAESGVAINSLVEQGATTLAKIFDNYLMARRLAGELLLSMIREQIGTKPRRFSIERNGRQVPITLNGDQVDETGTRYRTNDLARTRARVELEDVPSSPSHKAQQLQSLTEFARTMPPEVQMAMVDLMVKASDIEGRDELADRISQITGYGAGQDAGPQVQQQQMLMMQEQQLHKALATRESEARVRDMEINVMLKEQQLAAGQQMTQPAQTQIPQPQYGGE